MIHLHNINMVFYPGTVLEKKALKNINLTIEKGEFITVIGGNGAGKSTLLRVITGDLFPTRGKILINNQDVTTTPPEKRARFVSQVFQDPRAGACPNLTIEENMALAVMRGKKRGLRMALTPFHRRQFQEALASVKLGLEGRLGTPLGMLSGGQRQAISLLMSVLGPSEILVLDEHTAALDPKTSSSILKLTEQLIAEKKLTVLMVTHSMHQALLMGSRTLMFNEGKIVLDFQGNERKKLNEEELLKIFKQKINEEYTGDEFILNN
jgi:putative ABC transport system ATP-binding protein